MVSSAIISRRLCPYDLRLDSYQLLLLISTFRLYTLRFHVLFDIHQIKGSRFILKLFCFPNTFKLGNFITMLEGVILNLYK